MRFISFELRGNAQVGAQLMVEPTYILYCMRKNSGYSADLFLYAYFWVYEAFGSLWCLNTRHHKTVWHLFLISATPTADWEQRTLETKKLLSVHILYLTLLSVARATVAQVLIMQDRRSEWLHINGCD